MSKFIQTLFLAFVFFASAGHAEIYKTVDADGNVSYSDKPSSSDAKPFTLAPINSADAVKSSAPKRADDAVSEETPDYKIAVTSPANDHQIPTGQQNVVVKMSLQPNLQGDHRIQLYTNGKAFGNPIRSRTGVLAGIHRGTHIINAAVIDAQGNVLSKSADVTIHVQRARVPKPAHF